jgi:hypothetical protein
MKKILIVVITFMLTASLSAQVNWFRYIIDAHGGLKVGKTVEKTGATKTGSNVLAIDSIVINTTNKTIGIMKGADSLYAKPPLANQIQVIALADSFSTAKANSYATGKMLADGLPDNFIRGIQAGGSTILAAPLGFSGFGHANAALVDNYTFFIPIYVDKSITVTGVTYVLKTAMTSTPDAYNGIGLYSVSGTTYTLIDSVVTTSNGSCWKITADKGQV